MYKAQTDRQMLITKIIPLRVIYGTKESVSWDFLLFFSAFIAPYNYEKAIDVSHAGSSNNHTTRYLGHWQACKLTVVDKHCSQIVKNNKIAYFFLVYRQLPFFSNDDGIFETEFVEERRRGLEASSHKWFFWGIFQNWSKNSVLFFFHSWNIFLRSGKWDDFVNYNIHM